MHRLGGLAASLLLAVSLAGCATSAPPAESDYGSLFSDDEVVELNLACLRDKGWDVEMQDGAIVANFPEEQRDAYLEDSSDCLAEAGIDPDAAITDDQYKLIYQWYSDIEDCLKANGWSTPDRPSFEVFRSTYDSDPWIPWEIMPPEDYFDAKEVCPVMDPR